MATLTDSLRVSRASAACSGTVRRLPRSSRRGLVSALLDNLFAWQARAEERQALAQLDERLLRDIGLNRETAAREARKPFWQA